MNIAVSKIRQPIFMIGTGRNGSTLISDLLALHPELCWVSNYQDKYPSILSISYLNKFFKSKESRIMGATLNTKNKKSYHKRWIPRHSEAYNFWNYYTKEEFDRSFMSEQFATYNQIERVATAIEKLCLVNQSERFFAKLTGPPRITFLKSIFPDAIFILIKRDYRHVLESYLNVEYWKKGGGYSRPWWKGILSHQDKLYWQENKSAEVLAALQISNIVRQTEKELAGIHSANVIEIKYEQFIFEPKETMLSILKFCRLSSNENIFNKANELKIYNKEKQTPYLNSIEVKKILSSILTKDNYLQ